jgi:O-antigen ligase
MNLINRYVPASSSQANAKSVRSRDGSAQMPKSIKFVLYGTVATFYAANIYTKTLADPLAGFKWICLALLLALLGGRALKVGSLHRPAIALFGLVVSVLLISSVFSLDPLQSLAFVVAMSVTMITAQLVVLLPTDRRQIEELFNIFCNVGRLVITSSALMFVLGLNLGRGEGRFSGWADNPNTLGIMLAPTLAILLAELLQKRRGWLLRDGLFLVVGCYLLIETGSRASFLWVMVSGLSLAFGRKLSPIIFIVGLPAFLLIFLYQNEILSAIFELLNRENTLSSADALSGRNEMWRLALSLIEERPWLGYGFGMEQTIIETNSWQFLNAQGFHFHNSYLTLLVETGILGTVVLLAPLIVLTLRSFFSLAKFRNASIRESITYALPVALSLGAWSHSIFETWIFSPGNSNTLLFWICIWLMRQDMKCVPRRSIANDFAQRSHALGNPLLHS